MNLFVLRFFYSLAVVFARINYDDRPRIHVQKGHLIFSASPYKNISFEISKTSGVSINNIDLLTTLNKAHDATKLTDNYHRALTTYNDRLDVLEERLLHGGPVNFNSSSSNNTINMVKIRRINRRLLMLERAVSSMKLLMYKDDCLSNPCKNGGTCEDLIGKYRCRCSEGWEGQDCTENINECYTLSGTDLGCQNGATCTDTDGGYKCACASGWVGLHCTRKKADCLTAGKELCGHGICVEHGNDHGYKCICDQGYTTEGENPACTKDVDECNQNHPPCSVNPKVECRNVPGSYFCGFCPQGYSGNGYYCADIDECQTDNGGCSQTPMVNCINTPGSRSCGPCPLGYSGNGVTCTYEGECNINNGGCHPVATCKHHPGISTANVECICPFGYIGDGRGPNGCVMNTQNACASSPCLNGNCTALPAGGYICKCKGSYTGRNCDVLGRDPCHPNPCLNEGECQNLPYSTFKCKCKSGFSGVWCESEEAACGGLTKANSGVLKYPTGNHNSFKHYVNCAWTIVANDSTKVLNITFKKFDLEESHDCQLNFLEIHDGSNTVAPTKGRFCGNKLPLGGNFTSTHDRLYLWLKSDNGVGQGGFEIEWKAINWKCGGQLQDKHGTIWSPGSPGKYPPRRDCWWRLVAPPGKRFLFTFFSLDIGDNKDCSQDLLQFFTMTDLMRENDKFKRICNSTMPEPFYSPGNRVMIHFHSNLKDTFNGFQLHYVVQGAPGCGGYFTAPTGYITSPSTNDESLECEYIIEQPALSKIAISFIKFDLVDSSCEGVFIQIFDGDDSSLGRYCGSTIPSPYTSIGNRLRIVYSYSFSAYEDNANAQWKISYKRVCGQKFTNESGSFTPFAYYSSSGAECIYQIERPPGHIIELLLTVKGFRFESLGSRYSWDCFVSVEVRDGDSESAPLINRYCGTQTVNITSTYNALWLKLKILSFSYSLSSDFFKAEYTSIETGCGGILRNPFGSISSPSHVESGYPPGSQCTWIILAPLKHIIKLSWQTFSIEQSFSCAYDYVKVFNNDTDLGTGEEIGKFCGGITPPLLFSTSNIMTVVFNSDMTVSKGGFLATYVFIKEDNACNIHYMSSAGVLKSPKYPETYPINQDCTYTISVPPGQQILLNVTDFDIEFSPGCRYDWLEIRNGKSSSSPLIGRYCGNSTVIPKLIFSHTNKLYFFFKSDISRGSTGFSIKWSSSTTGCGGTLSSPTGSITSPNYPEPYEKNAECTWKIVVNTGSRIQIYFTDINLEENDSQCSMDYVQLFDGITTNSRSLGKFCVESEGPITSTTNQMLVKFRSDVNLEGRGFNLRYTTMCHNVIRGFEGVIESPNFPNSYPQSQDCMWEIIVPERNKINITFSHFELERELILSNITCQYDYVEIKYAESIQSYSDEDEELQTYAKYCGNNNPGHLSMDSDHVAVHFVSDKLLVGSGFRLEWVLWGCGGLLKKNSGTISSPNYPKPYPPSISCDWKIEVEFGYSIQLEFHEVDIERTDTCNFDYINVYDGPSNDSNLITTICRQKKVAVLPSTGNFMYIEFKADYSYQGKGFFANYSTTPTNCGGRFTAERGSIYSPNYPQNYNKNESCGWLIDVDEGSSVQLTFEDVDLYETENCTANYVKVHDGPTEAYPVLAKICGTTLPNDSIISTYNHMYIAFRTHTYITTKGFKATYRKSCGSKITTQSNGIIDIEKSEFLDEYNKCVWTISSTDLTGHVYLFISMIHGSGPCNIVDGEVKVYNGDSISAPLMGSYCDEKIPNRFVSDGSSITVELNNPQITFVATYSVFESECGGSLFSEGGYFASPGYPNTYPSGAECEWTIQVSPGNRMSLNFLTFDLPESGCDNDYLEVRAENSSGAIIGVYCGTNKPTIITNVGPMWLLFKSKQLEKGDMVNSKGFHAEYEMSASNELSGSSGKIYSPLYPKSYMKYGIYSWQITVKQRKRILLSFLEFYVEADDTNNECYFSDLQVYDGVDDSAPSLGSFCGVTVPQPVKSTSNIIYLKASFVNPKMGSKFRIEWMEINEERFAPKVKKNTTCGSDETIDLYALKNYTLSSPGFPNGYRPNLHCTWVFSTAQMNHISMYFYTVDFGLLTRRQPVAYCTFTDHIKISKKEYDKNDWQEIVNVCKIESVQDRIQATNLVKLEFITDSYLNGTGFKAKLFEVCGGHLTEKSGYIEYLNDTIFASTNCEWNITVRSTKIIEIVFENMYILNSQNDVCENYLLIKNGKYPDSPYLGTGKYCGTSLPPPMKSTGNTLYLKYKGGKPNKSTFRLKYREVSSNLCGGNIMLSLFDNSTEIKSPNYPNIPKPHSECQWIITAPVGESIRIDFVDRFDLTYSKTCEKEYVELRNGGTEHSPLIGKYCKTAPDTQVTTGNMLFIKFFTDIDDPKNGFKAKIYLGYCGGTIRGNSGSVKLITLPSNVKNAQCDWYVIGPHDHYLILHFTKFNMDYCTLYNNKNSTGVSIFETNFQNNTKTLIGEYCAKNVDEVPNNITTSFNEISVHYTGSNTGQFTLSFKASQSKCGGNVRGESGEITSPGYPGSIHYNRICFWRIEVPEGRRITVEMNDIDFGPNRQMLTFYDGLNVKLFFKVLTQMPENKIIESSSNILMIRYWVTGLSNHRGFKLTYTSNKPTICSGDFNKNKGIIYNPSVRNTSYSCKWTRRSERIAFNQTLAITINLKTSFDLNICNRAPGEIQVTNEDPANILGRVCRTTYNPYIIRSPYIVNNLVARVNNRYSMNFTASYSIYPCGGLVRQQSGTIRSPVFSVQPETVECVWLINVDDGQTVNLTVTNLNLGSDCDASFISVYNGDSPRSPHIGKFCRNNKPDPIISQTRALWIEYRREKGSTGTGMTMEYEAISHGCSGIFHDKSRIISTPNYSKDYPNNAECLWEVRSTEGYLISLRFIDRFHLESSDNCTKDFLEVFDWKHDEWISLGKKCGRNTPSDINSTSNRLRILFRSNSQTTARGFKARWDWHCGGKFEATSTPHFIVSPGYPMTYENGLKCVYTIESKANRVLSLRFIDFELEGTFPDCRYDNLTITSSIYIYGSTYNKNFCGDNKPPPIRTRGSVTINFKTDYFLTKRGFKLIYADESCGGTIDKETIIDSSNFIGRSGGPRYFEPNIQCQWNITAPPKQQVILTIIKLSMTYSSMCYQQHVSVYKSFELKIRDRLAKFCTQLENLVIVSDTGKMALLLFGFPRMFEEFRAAVTFSHGPEEGCGGNVNLTDTLYISSLNVESMDCTWKIVAPQDYIIQIQFSELKFSPCLNANRTGDACNCAIIEIRDGNTPFSELIEKICPTSIFTKDSRIFSTSFNRAYIRFSTSDRKETEFTAKVTPTLSNCGHSTYNVTKTPQILTSPGYPNQYPANTRCTYLFYSTFSLTDRIRLHFIDFDLTEVQPPVSGHQLTHCTGDTVEIYENPYDPNQEFGPSATYAGGANKNLYLHHDNGIDRNTFCGKEDKPFDYLTSGKKVVLVLNSLDDTRKGRGFKLEYLLDDCNRNHSETNGYFVDNNNLRAINCTFYITVPENRTISLYFNKFATRFSANCTDQWFEVRDKGKDGPVLLKFCGLSLPNPVFSSTNVLYISIIAPNQMPGIRLIEFAYTSTDKGRGCGGEMFNIKGKIYSPLYPNQFRNNTKCDWIIKVPVGLHTMLKFLSFDIQGNCDDNYLEITTHSSAVTTDASTTRFCRNDNPGTIRSETSIEIHYKSSVMNAGAGWIAVYRGVNKDLKNIPGF